MAGAVVSGAADLGCGLRRRASRVKAAQAIATGSSRRRRSVETTLRTTAAIEQAELARKSGFATEMRFVATNSIVENVARVLQRAQAGGHGASEREIRAIHLASVANLRTAVAAFDRVRVYDSTTRWAPPRLVAVARGGELVRHGTTPAWLEGALAESDE